MNDLVPLLVLLTPLAAALVNGASLFAGDRWLHWRTVQRVTVGAAALSFLGALWLFAGVLLDPTPRRIVLFEWLLAGELRLPMGLLIDTLSALMALMVTGFAFVIGRFSINYMHNERGFTRYFAAYALFVFAMLVLVLGDNYVMLFAGWEAVGVCSYLLIGQYYDRNSAARASTEAFIANRVGDAGFIIGILILINEFGAVRYDEVMARLPAVEPAVVSAAAFCLLLGAVGKSAQLPLGSWLAKAMEGPTPSSALIHAATMVTAGVYLIVRSQELYNAAPTVLLLVALIGAATALYGAVVGQTSADIKGLLAASTTTQLGFMFLACGLGAYAVAVFHLLAHAFLKSYLFLTAPSILHHLHGRLDPAEREAPRESPSVYIVITVLSGLMVVGPLSASLLGSGPLAGWTPAVWVMLAGGLLAVVTAGYYAFSLTRKIFGDTEHQSDQVHAHEQAHEHAAAQEGDEATAVAPVAWPLTLVALAAAGGVALQIFPGGLDNSWFRLLVAPVMTGVAPPIELGSAALRLALALVLVAMVIYAWFTAVYLGRFRAEAGVDLRSYRWLYLASLNRLWLDAFTRRVVVGGVLRLGRLLDRFDVQVLDFLVRVPGRVGSLLGTLVGRFDEALRGRVEQSPAAVANIVSTVSDVGEQRVFGGAEGLIRNTSATLASFAAFLERYLFGGFEILLRRGSATLASCAAFLERYLFGGVETLLRRGVESFARLGIGIEGVMARPAVAVMLIGVVLVAAWLVVS